MPAGERFKGWIDDAAVGWADRLATWGMGLLARGITKTLEDIEPTAIDSMKETLLKVRDDPNTPDDLKAFIDKVITPGNPLVVVAGILVFILMMTGTIGALFAPLNRATEYKVDRAIESFRMDPMSIITAWRRDPEKYAWLFDDLEEKGWSDKKIEALKFFTLVYPSRQDGIRYVAKEALEPESIEKYGLMEEFDRIDLSLFEQIGVPVDTVKLDWIAHWEHASWIQIVEMLHRGLITEQDVYEWFRLVEIPPYWRDFLIQTAYTWPTRVDVRRWWDMRTIDEAELRRLYSGMGYRGVNLDNYVLWTKVYVAFPDLMARWSKGWISLADVRTELTGLGMPAERLEEFIQMKVKAEQPARTESERDLTKTDIYKGIKADRITRGEGIELLMDLGFDEDEAVLLLDTNVPLDLTDVVVAERKISKADILKGLKTEVINRDEARDRLMELRYTASDAELLLKIYEAQVKPPEELREREASKADIVLGVKKGLLDEYEGYTMLLDLGFSASAADFILMVKAEVSPFSPINFAEFKDRTQKYRIAAGKEAKPMPEEIKKAAAEVVGLTGEVEALNKSIEEESRGLFDQEAIPEEATKRLKELQVKRNRAESKLSKAKSDYDRQIAEWRHGF